VFVGDIHGCKNELDALLKKVHFDPATDHLIATGDIIAKGPDSKGVVELLRKLNASCVRGNHEDRLLLVAEDLRSTSLQGKGGDGQHKSFKADDSERELIMSLDNDQLEWLRSCPVILHVGEMKAFGGDVVVVHAGLVPGLSLTNQDPASVMNMRVVDLGTHVPSKAHERKGSVPWYKLWNKFQQLIPAQQRISRLKGGKSGFSGKQTTVIYGHDSKKGLQIHKYTKGLDTGCVKGEKLTALVADAAGKQQIVQVQSKCKG
jgi:hypothetical protein